LADNPTIEINKATLFSVLNNQPDIEPWKETKALLTLLSAGESLPDSKVIELPEVVGGTQIAEIEIADSVREKILTSLNLSEVVRIEVPVHVFQMNGTSEHSKFRIYMQQTEQRVGIQPVYFRDALRISGIKGNREINGIRTVFIADGIQGNRTLADLLRLSEGPSHTEWQSKQKVKDKYKHVFTWIKLCNGMPKRLVSLIRGSREEANNQSLSDLFPDPSLQTNTPRRGSGNRNSTTGRVNPGGGGSGGGGGGGGGGTASPEPFIIAKLMEECGFEVSLVDGVKTKKAFTVEMAYERSRGTGSFKAWQELDFTTEQLNINCIGGTTKADGGNRIVVSIKDPEKLRLTVKGFDKNRNPLVKLSEGDLSL
jgi:uncharacterized membrane protein YgcG